MDSSGCFQLEARSWVDEGVRIDAPGRAWTLVALTQGHETRDRAREIRLSRAAQLEVLALGPLRVPLADARIRLSANTYELTQSLDWVGGLSSFFGSDPVTWDLRSGLDGRARFEGLPPEVAFLVEASAPGADALRVVAEAPPLRAGELRTLEIRVGSGATIAGRVQRQDGTPVPRAEVWMRPWKGRWSAVFRSHEEDEVRTAATRDGGDFAFEEVTDGEWVLALQPEGPQAAAPERVTVLDGVADREIVLVAFDDLFISGSVVDPQGQPAAASVIAFGGQTMAQSFGNSDREGRFSLGPLPPDTYHVHARTAVGSTSAPVQVQAGATDLILELELGGRIAGRVVDALTGEGVTAKVIVAPQRGANERWIGGTFGPSDTEGQFKFEGLPSGTYCAAASTPDGAFGLLRGLQLAEGARIEDLIVHVRPGARLRLHYDGPQDVGHFRVFDGDSIVAMDGVRRGTSSTLVVPLGRLSVECSEYPGSEPVVRTQEVTVEAGAPAELRFGPDDGER